MGKSCVEFKDIAENVFAPIYPVIARNIVEITGIVEGVCIEIGAGTGILSRSLSKITRLRMFALDMSKNMCKLVKYYNDNKYPVESIAGNVEDLPVKSLSVDLVVSRGSVFFWQNKIKAFSEIYRILKPYGMAYIGGGFGNKLLRKQITKEMKIIKPSWESERVKRLMKLNPHTLKTIMEALKIPHYQIIDDDSGLWTIIKRETK